MNHLSRETSPYLLQHQHNPVDWHPWGEEAFAAAREQDKPIFLSVGYSTCYWCHVMERECFESPFIAAEMNRLFINIKVDREERPDVDQLYMTAVQLLTRHGGWPMSVFLTPDLRPFYGGTYFPPNDMQGRPGFPTLLAGLEDAYRNRRSAVDRSANQLVAALQQLAQPPAPAESLRIDAAFVTRLINRSTADYDPQHGGFGSAPKFPRESLLELLLSHNRHAPDPTRLAMITHTLDALAHGGIRDQLGGGFHRYSTDAEWLVPHFEIMGYDNALLGWCYVEAFAQTSDPRYAAVARGTFDFILREMTSPAGAFYTAFDAEVDSQEGLNYLWTEREVRATLAAAPGNSAAAIIRFCTVYGLTAGPNFADPHHGSGIPEKNILFLPDASTGPESPLLDEELASLRGVLYAARRLRKQPLLDTKIITSWNGLTIRAMAFAGRVFAEPRYVTGAAKAAEYLLEIHRTADGGLYRTSRDGTAKHAGFLDDYAALAEGCLALQEATGEPRWRGIAAELTAALLTRFGDDTAGGFFFNEANSPDLIVRQKVASDSPLPSGNAIAARVLIALGQLDAARSVLAAFAQQTTEQGEGMSALVQAMDQYLRVAEPFTVATTPAPAAVPRPASPQRQAAEVVQLSTRWLNPQLLQVRASVASSYHINARPAAAGLVETLLGVTSGGAAVDAAIEYPAGSPERVAFAAVPLSVYSGEVIFAVRLAKPAVGPLRLSLRYQACDRSACLPPATAVVDAALP